MDELNTDQFEGISLPEDDEQLLHAHVIQGDHALLYLDTYLNELLRPV